MITRQAKAEQGSRLLLQADIEYCIKQVKELPRQLKSAKDMSELLVKAAKVGKRGVATLGYANELTQSLYEILFKYCLDKTYNRFFQDTQN